MIQKQQTKPKKRVATHLFEDAFNTRQRETCVVGFDDPPEQLVAENLQNHAHI